MKKLLVIFIVAMLMVGSGHAISAEQPVRTWTDLKGRKMEASFVQFSNDKVIIRREDGVSFNVSPAIFSEKDRKYLDEMSQKLNLPEAVEPVHKNLGPTSSNSNESKPIATKLISTATHKTVAGTGKMEGWTVYEPMVMVEREKAQDLTSGNESIEGAIIQFFASLMLGDKDFEAILSPTMKASVRERFTTEMPAAMTGLNQVSILGHAPFEQATQHRVLGKMATAGRETFGNFDSMVFCEGNTNRDDIPMLLVQYEGKWYVAGIFARQFEMLLDGPGEEKTDDDDEDGTEKKRTTYKDGGNPVSNESKPIIVQLNSQDVFGGKFHVVKRKLENGADPNAILLPKAKRTALHCCCMGGRVNIAKLLLAKEANPNFVDNFNNTPLDILFSPDEKGRTPLERMSAENQLEIQRILEKAGGKRNRLSSKEVDLDNNEILDKIIAGAIDGDKLETRGKKGERADFAPNSQTPYTGWAKLMWGNEQVKLLAQFEDGKGDGLFTSWHENGQKKQEANFKDGKKDGLYTSWYENGQKSLDGNYKDGKGDGLVTAWHENGQKKREAKYKDGKHTGLYTSWYDNGQKEQEVKYKDGKRTGLETWWYNNGQKAAELKFNDGKRDGLWVEYNEDGIEKKRTTYKDGEVVED